LRGAEDFPGKAILYEFGKQPDMVDMCVRNDNIVYFPRFKAPMAVQLQCHFTKALEHTAVKQNFLSGINMYQVLGAGNGTCGSMKCYLHLTMNKILLKVDNWSLKETLNFSR